MILQIQNIVKRHQELELLLADPKLATNSKQYILVSKEYKEKGEIVAHYNVYKETINQIETLQALLPSESLDIQELVKEEIEELKKRAIQQQEQLKDLLIPKDPNDSKNCILELRAGTGGDEAGIWVGDLFRMYQRFAEQKNWQVQVLDYTEGTSGGYKEVVATLSGTNVYGIMKFECGVHRVQRVPKTETQGRVHTSAASVAVLPEVDDVSIDIDMNEVRKDTFCSSGPGGQSVNTTYSAVRLTHIPTGIVVSCQDGKSQLKNFEKALKVLRARLYERALKEQQESVGAERRSMIGSGDRSDKIRTYNYPQGRVTDHRIQLTTYNLQQVLDGELDQFIEKLQIHNRMQHMKKNQTK